MGADPRRLVVAIAFLGILAAGVAWALRTPPISDAATGGAPGAIATTSSTSVQVTTTKAVESTPAPSATAAPSTTPVVSSDPPDIVTLDAMLVVAERAFEAWGEFAVTGDLDVVSETFDERGPQYEQVRAEAPVLSASPLGSPPYVFTMTDAVLERPRPQRVVLAGVVTVTRPGDPDQQFEWRVHFRWSGIDWLLWTVEDG